MDGCEKIHVGSQTQTALPAVCGFQTGVSAVLQKENYDGFFLTLGP